MSNFNNGRVIDLKAYLPDILRETTELGAIMDAERPEIMGIWQAVESCMDDQFITTATRNGVARREKMLSIVPYSTDTLEDRRFRLLTRYNENIPYTRKSLLQVLGTLCGEDYSIQFLTKDFTINVKVSLTVKKQVSSVEQFMERTLPYNMKFNVELLYNTWNKLGTFRWEQLKEYTWHELKEEVLPDAN